MADFCNKCAVRLDFPKFDIDVPRLVQELEADGTPSGISISVMCEGCGLIGVGKYDNRIQLAFLSNDSDGDIRWVDYDASEYFDIRPLHTPLEVFMWLDDVRDPERWLQGDYEAIMYNVVWVKNYDEFVEYITEYGIPKIISFDHDLASEHYAPPEEWEHNYDAWAATQSFTEKTGLDCAKWLVELCENYGFKLPITRVHSANPDGAKNIRSYLENAKKHLNL